MKLNTILLIAILGIIAWYLFKPVPAIADETAKPDSTNKTNEPVQKTTIAEEIATVIKRRIIPTTVRRIIPKNTTTVELDQFTGKINWKGR